MARGVGGRGPANIMKHIKGIHFPATKEAIVNQAMQGPGPDRDLVIEVLQQIPEKEYASPAEIMKEIGKIK